MNSFSLGDLAQTFILQRRGAALQANMTRLNEELATGKVSDIKSVLAGNVSYLADIERDLKTLSGYKVATIEATQFTETAQLALSRIDESVTNISASLLTMSPNAAGPVLDQFSSQAKVEMATIISALNTSTAGRALFAGSATNQQALEDIEVILSGLRVATAGATSPQDIMVAANSWFNDPAGFQSTAYRGSDASITPFRLAEAETMNVQMTAKDSVFRNILRDVAVATIASDSALGLSADDRRSLLQDAGQGLFRTQNELTATRANTGLAQSRIDELATRNAAEENALNMAKNALIQVDPYEAATELEAVQFQLQSLYTITARMSDMSFVNFIR